MKPAITLDLFDNKAFKRTMEYYIIASRKTMAEAINKQAGNVVYEAYLLTPPAGRLGEVKRPEADKLRSNLENLPITKDEGRKRYGDKKYVGALKLMNWQRKNSGLVPRGNGRFRRLESGRRSPKNPRQGRRFADGLLKKFISRRTSSIGFIKVGWAVAAAAFGRPFTRGREGFPQSTLNRLGGFTLAMPGVSTEATFTNSAGRFDVRFKPKIPRAESGAVKVGYSALVKAVDIVASKMLDYIEPRIQRIYDAGLKGIGPVTMRRF